MLATLSALVAEHGGRPWRDGQERFEAAAARLALREAGAQGFVVKDPSRFDADRIRANLGDRAHGLCWVDADPALRVRGSWRVERDGVERALGPGLLANGAVSLDAKQTASPWAPGDLALVDAAPVEPSPSPSPSPSTGLLSRLRRLIGG